MKIDQRLKALRINMAKYGLAAYIVPSSDPHQSEYVADYWKTRTWLSGFSGSAGLLIVTADHAGLWTDSRYFIQAAQELQGSGVELHRQKIPHAPEHVSWLAEHLPAGSAVGCDGFLFSLGQINYLERQLSKKEITLHTELDLITDIWRDRPPLPKTQVFQHNEALAGQSRRQKLDVIYREMEKLGASHYLITTLDDIAWTLNLRGSDVECNPVFISYLLIGRNESILFVDQEKVSSAIHSALRKDGVQLKPYIAIESHLELIPESASILIHTASISIRLFQALKQVQVIKGANIPLRLKAIKNEVEIAHIRKTMVKDGVALLQLYRWLEETLASGSVTEFEVSQQLGQFRAAQKDYQGESFSAIVGYEGNGAIIHYRPEKATSARIKPEGILLLDSGGQYLDGTTDITRTTALGPVTEVQRRDFTLVLKGHIALARTKFPAGTTGAQLDGFARMYLWEHGLNYGHGTGHGVGFFLNVHEPPQGFATSATTSRGATAIEPGMLTSNEPGFYKDGAYGIRIENLVLCVAAEKTDYGQFLRFDTLTLFPIDISLIDLTLLAEHEKDWLNEYHERVYTKLMPHLETEEANWLKEKCKAI